VLAGDDYPSLHARIQVEEHRIYPIAVQMVTEKIFA
jgi:folate-dependent phosphoribosylglycinamide formyltransferase PurN